jgi:RHS repeat-associated protein
VLRIANAYEVRGMVSGITSYDNAIVGSGNVVNDVQLVYNSFAQVIADYQSHVGAVNQATTPLVQFGYANGNTNTTRVTTMVYPNGRVLNYNYGPTGGMNDALSRIASLIDTDGVTNLAEYYYLGLSSIIEVAESQPGLAYTLLGLTPGNDPVTGDIYQGLDLFGRIKNLIWTSTGGSSSSSSSSSGAANVVNRIQYGYDRAGNRLWRQELGDPTETHDELYHNDGLYRLTNLQRGTLNSSQTAILSETFAQCWGLDATGNWQNYREDNNGDGVWDLVQGRRANPVNEIAAVNNSVGSPWTMPGYDAAGNMTILPQPGNPGMEYGGIYDAWNRLVSLSSGGSQVAEYQYDGFRRRIVKQTYSGGVQSEIRHFYYSPGWQILEERVGTSNVPDRQFVWGIRYVDDLVLRDRDSNDTGVLNERLYAVQDSTWNVITLLNSVGLVEERYEYDGYGTLTVMTSGFGMRGSSLFDWEISYAGYRLDGESGLYLVRHRYYHSILGCFLSRDLVVLSQTNVNLYQYAFNQPINAIDPDGTLAFIVIGIIAVGVILFYPSGDNSPPVPSGGASLGTAGLIITRPAPPQVKVIDVIICVGILIVLAQQLAKTGGGGGGGGGPVDVEDPEKKKRNPCDEGEFRFIPSCNEFPMGARQAGCSSCNNRNYLPGDESVMDGQRRDKKKGGNHPEFHCERNGGPVIWGTHVDCETRRGKKKIDGRSIYCCPCCSIARDGRAVRVPERCMCG